MFKGIVIAGIGGFLGTCLRFYCEQLGMGWDFPIGTFVPNILGCFLIGVFYGLAVKTDKLSKAMNLFLITGFCGGFTTFSSLSLELVQHLQQGQDAMFWAYLISTVVVGFISVVLGIACVQTSKNKAAKAPEKL